MDWSEIALEAVNRHGLQDPRELAGVLGILAERRAERIVEIGVAFGGATWAWTQLPACRVVGVDLDLSQVATALPVGEALLLQGDSTHTSTVEAALTHLHGRPDFVFVDGDHSAAGVVADFETWAPVVAPGGLIGFHDIADQAAEGWRRVCQLVPEGRRTEIVRSVMGIGLVSV